MLIEPTEYFGCDLLVEQYEAINYTRLGKDVRMKESELYVRKWFDYRPLHPVQATYLFAACYQRVAQHHFAMTKDVDQAQSIKAFEPEDVFKGSERTSFTVARQNLDRIGVRYIFGINFAFKRCAERGWRIFPRPNQLHNAELLDDLRDAWQEECSVRMQTPRHPRYRADNYIEHPDQNAWHAWISREVDRRERKDWALAELFRRKLYPEAVAVKHFGSELVAKASRQNH